MIIVVTRKGPFLLQRKRLRLGFIHIFRSCLFIIGRFLQKISEFLIGTVA